MSVASISIEQRLVLSNISWAQYVGYSDLLGERHVRVTYDGARMEIMTVSPEHERAKHLLSRLLAALTEELNLDIAGFGSMTCRREDLERGLEPDECYWIENEPKIRGRTDIDLESDPPPDLVLEIEISRSVLDRLGLYARLGVPEVWRWDGRSLRACWLQADETYAEQKESRAFPFLPLAKLEAFLRNSTKMTETELVRKFRKWVSAQIEEGWKPSAEKKTKKKRRS